MLERGYCRIIEYIYLDHAKTFLDKILAASTDVLKQLEDAKDEQELITVGRCPVQALRELKEDGSEIFLGDISLVRCMHGELMGAAGPDDVDWDNKTNNEESNNQIPNGDPKIVWSFGGTWSGECLWDCHLSSPVSRLPSAQPP